MATYRETATAFGYDLQHEALADNLASKEPEKALWQADDTMLRGYIHPKKVEKTYRPVIDFTDANKSKCDCGYWLPYKYGSRYELCQHQIYILKLADAGEEVVQGPALGQRSQHAPRTTTTHLSAGNSAAKSQAFQAVIKRAITSAIEDLADITEALIDRGKIPFLLGPTGCGKTSCIDLIVGRRGVAYETIGGQESSTEADLVGLHTSRMDIEGLLARAFRRARNGEKVYIFADEFPRFPKRVQNLFMIALLPKPASIAKALGIKVDEAPGYTEGDEIYMTEAAVWGTEWAPAKNIVWIFGGNTWGSKYDPAFIRRVQPVKVGYSEKVLKPFGTEMAEFIKTTWDLCSAGQIPLPIEYGMIASMKNAKDTSIFPDYIAKLETLDPALTMSIKDIMPAIGKGGELIEM